MYDSVRAGGLPVEFDVDLQLARLIDEANPDRAGIDGPSTPDDIALGWRDGVLDIMDTYAKIRGRLSFAVSFEEWEVANDGTYQTVVQGTIAANLGEAPVTCGATNEELRELTTGMFENAATWYESRVAPGGPATPADFAQVGVGGTFEPGDVGHNRESTPFGPPGAQAL